MNKGGMHFQAQNVDHDGLMSLDCDIYLGMQNNLEELRQIRQEKPNAYLILRYYDADTMAWDYDYRAEIHYAWLWAHSAFGLIDLFPTLVDLTGIEHPDTLDGESLLSVIEGKADPAGRETFSEFYKWGMSERMIRTPEWKYVHTEGDVAQLYDVKNDPRERVNLSGEKTYADVCRELSDRVHDGWEKPDPQLIQPPPKPS